MEFKIHPEQIAGLNTVRSDNLHSCTGAIGDPGGTIGVEILLDGDDNFQTYEPSFKSISDTNENCTIYREYKFWIAFTAAMDNATIRCKITNDEYPTDPPINSNNEKLALVPGKLYCHLVLSSPYCLRLYLEHRNNYDKYVPIIRTKFAYINFSTAYF